MKVFLRNFDGYQQRELGKSHILGFGIMGFLLMTLPIVDLFYGKPVFAEKMDENMFILFFSLTVVACYQVLKEAYFPVKIKQNKLRTGLFLVSVGVSVGLVEFFLLGNGPLFKNGQINDGYDLYAAFFFLGPGLLILGKSLIGKFLARSE
ncbi:hypothetical protein P7H43_10825 [Enterococcus asini]|uniref:DUF3995 domain-containing protein n=1 Tax=Enterococcus asini TaxID=57732 RepID=A0AAW8U2K5_9ENTE|nr:hypothetical protein [Enterococcus asini]MDT2810969.1 hypothetical protein [Enterococcus asini]